HPGAYAGLLDHFIEQAIGTVVAALGVDGGVESIGIDEVAQRPLEVGRQLSGVVTCRAPPDAIAFDQQNARWRVAQYEERRGDAGDPGTDDRDVGRQVLVQWS